MNGKAAAAEMDGGTGSARRRTGIPRLKIEFDPVRTGSPWWMPIAAVAAALAVCAVFIAASGMDPLAVYRKMLTGAFGTRFGATETLVKSIPLLLCGIGVSIAYRISFWNIGAEGQFLAGAMAATAVTIYMPDLPAAAALPLMTAAGIAAGGLWGLLTAVPRAYFQVNELISSLMLNYIALLLLDYFVFGPWRDPGGLNFPGSPMFTAEQSLPTFGRTRLHFGLVFALLAVLLYAFMFRYTRWGYEMRLIGSNPEAARNAGINLNRHLLLVMLASGGLAGLAGMAEVSGVAHRLMYGISPGYGYTAIIVAWIARLHPLGLILSAFLFGGLIVGGYSVQTLGLPSATSEMLQGAVLFFLIAGAALGMIRVRRAL
jgi:ABC-type uncharacterized transport system, permease component